MKRMLVVAAMACGLAAAPASATTELLTNGGFETGDFTGWYVDGNWSVVPQQDLFGNYEAAGFNTEGNTLSQMFAGVAGQQYTLSLDYAGGSDADPAILYFFITQYPLQTSYALPSTSDTAQQFSTVFTNTNGISLLNLQIAAGPNLIRLDDVSITPFIPAGVPEPATWAMMLLGFGAMGLSFRRTRRALSLAA